MTLPQPSPTLPASQLADADGVRRLTGSFWSEVLRDDPVATGVARAIAGGDREHAQQVHTLWQSRSRQAGPGLRTGRVRPLTLTRADKLAENDTLYYGGDGAYGAGDRYLPPGAAAAWPLPAGLHDAAAVATGLGSADAAWHRGVDLLFDRARGQLRFLGRDPLPADRDEVVVWLIFPRRHPRLEHEQRGAVAGMPFVDSPWYREAVQASLLATAGANRAAYGRAWAAVSGTPAAAADGETVTQAWDRDGLKFLATDHAMYRLTGPAGWAVAPGDVLHAGQPLADAVRLWWPTPTGGLPPWLAALPDLPVPAAWLGVTGEPLRFATTDSPITYTPHSDQVGLTLGGGAAAVDRFLTNANTGQPLARMLAGNPAMTFPPAAVPASFVPAAWVAQTHLSPWTAVVGVDAGRFGPDALGLDYWPHLRPRVEPAAARTLMVPIPPQ